MDKALGREILEYQDFLGFSIKRERIRLEDNKPHDESIALGVCHRFYGKEEELDEAIVRGNKILKKLILMDDGRDKAYLSLFYALIGNMYYLKDNFNYATGYFMKVLDYEREDLTAWVELLFSLRAMGEFELFEEGIFNLEKIYKEWMIIKDKEMDKGILISLIRSISKGDINNKIKQEILYFYKTNQIEFISLIRFFYGPKKSGRLCTNYEKAKTISKLIKQKGYYSAIIPRALTQAANLGDKNIDPQTIIDQLKQDKNFDIINKKEGLVLLDKQAIKKIIEYNIRNNTYRFYDTERQYKKYEINQYFLYFGKEESFMIKDLRREILEHKLGDYCFDYPPCCIKNYSGGDHHFYEICKGGPNRRKVSYLMNCLPVVYALFEHYPCSWTCNNTLKIAQETLISLREFDLNIYKEVLNQLKCTCFLTENAIIIFEKSFQYPPSGIFSVPKNQFRIEMAENLPYKERINSVQVNEGRIIFKGDCGENICEKEGYLIEFC